MGVGISDNNQTGGARVNTDGELTIATNKTAIKSGFSSLVAEKGILPDGTRVMQELECSEDYRLRTEGDNILFSDYPTGTNLNTSIFTTRVTTQTMVMGSNRYELNSSGITTINTGSMIRTCRTFQWYRANTLYGEFCGAWTLDPVANWFAEWGFFNATSAIAAISDGVFFRITAGQFRGVLCNGGIESYVDLGALPVAADEHDFIIEMVHDGANFWVDGSLVGRIEAPITQFAATAQQQLPLAARTYNGGVIPAVAIKLQISTMQVSNGGADLNRLWATCRTGMGGGAYQTPSGAAAGQTANWANSAAVSMIAAASLVNTTGSFTGLGGQFWFGAPAGADTDYHIMKYLVPVGSTLVIRGIRIETFNTVVAVATTASVLQWGLGVGATADTLAGTEDAVGVKIRRVIPLGIQSFAVGAAVGAAANPIDINLDAPAVVHGGEYVSFLVKVPIGTATATEGFRGLIMVNGYFE